jgi:hypothetical protein
MVEVETVEEEEEEEEDNEEEEKRKRNYLQHLTRKPVKSLKS